MSEVPWGAAMTSPGRPFSTCTLPPGAAVRGAGMAGAGGASADSFPAISPAQPWTRRARPTTRLPGPRLVISGIIDQHGLRHRVLAIMGQREQDAPAALGERDRAALAVQGHGGSLPALAANLELTPVHTHAEPGAERLEGGLLGREASREVRDRIAAAPAIRDLLLGEHPL